MHQFSYIKCTQIFFTFTDFFFLKQFTHKLCYGVTDYNGFDLGKTLVADCQEDDECCGQT